jgi:hypothetical protein
MSNSVQSELESRIYRLIVRTSGRDRVRPTDWSTIAAACKGSSEPAIMEAIQSLIAKDSIHKTSGGWLPGQDITPRGSHG